jgi:hypothetical protein
MVVAVLELASAVVFMVPKTRPFGWLLVSAYLGGAIAAQLEHGLPPEPPAAFLALIPDMHVAEKSYLGRRV